MATLTLPATGAAAQPGQEDQRYAFPWLLISEEFYF
jgi:hypothetical protein